MYLLIQQPKQLAMLTYKTLQQLMTASVKCNLVPVLSLLFWAQIYERKLSNKFYIKARIVSTAVTHLQVRRSSRRAAGLWALAQRSKGSAR